MTLDSWSASPYASGTNVSEVLESLTPAPLDAEHRALLRDAVGCTVSDDELERALAVITDAPFEHSPQERMLAIAIRDHALFQRVCAAGACGDGVAVDRLLRAGADYSGSVEVLNALSVKAVIRLRKMVGSGVRAYIDQVVGSSRVDLQACKLEYSIVSPK